MASPPLSTASGRAPRAPPPLRPARALPAPPFTADIAPCSGAFALQCAGSLRPSLPRAYCRDCAAGRNASTYVPRHGLLRPARSFSPLFGAAPCAGSLALQRAGSLRPFLPRAYCRDCAAGRNG